MHLNADCNLSKMCVVANCACGSNWERWAGSVNFSSALGVQWCVGRFCMIVW